MSKAIIKVDDLAAPELDVESGERTTTTTHPLHSVFPRDTKMGAAIAWWAAGWFMYTKIKNLHNWLKEHAKNREKFTVGISSWEEHELYAMVFQWIAEHLDAGQKLDNYLLVSGYTRRRYHVHKASAGQGLVEVTMAGIPVKVAFSEKEGKEEGSSMITKRRDLIIKCKSQEEVDTITAFISELWHRWSTNDSYDAPVEETEVAVRYPYHVWGSTNWYVRRFVRRDKDSVILKQGQREDLFNDVERFLSLKSEYHRVNIPWHRGYLLYGPAGTGKTSLALAIASTFDIPVYSLSLSTMENSKDLLKAVAMMDSEEAVLIIEDIDVAYTTHSRETNDGKEPKVALDVLLNILDGAGTPSGLITILTTNYIDRLDEALIRPGRVDYKLLVDNLNDDQLHRLVEWYTGVTEFKLPKIESTISPAEITGVVKAYIGHPELCLAQVRSLIEVKNGS